MSMIAALYLTYPTACTFDGAHPPLLNLNYNNMHISQAYTGLNCLPKPQNLLKNWSFETPGANGQIAQKWLGTALSGDKRIMNKPFSGHASFVFDSTTGFNSMLSQQADLTPGFTAGEKLLFAFSAKGQESAARCRACSACHQIQRWHAEDQRKTQPAARQLAVRPLQQGSDPRQRRCPAHQGASPGQSRRRQVLGGRCDAGQEADCAAVGRAELDSAARCAVKLRVVA
jgi:hypothetical protein